jgi:hypothetical protein
MFSKKSLQKFKWKSRLEWRPSQRSSGNLNRVALVITDDSEEHIASIVRDKLDRGGVVTRGSPRLLS